MGVVWVHWLMARGQILKDSLVPLATPYVTGWNRVHISEGARLGGGWSLSPGVNETAGDRPPVDPGR